MERRYKDPSRKKRAIILVLGDIGRSPRMMYHARSLSMAGINVDLCGYEGEKVIDGLFGNKGEVNLHYIPTIKTKENVSFIIGAIKKIILQHFYLFKLLWELKDADYLLVQNPPAIPLLSVVKIYVNFISRRTNLVIDWHNLGYTVLGVKLGDMNNKIVTIAKRYESFFGKSAYAHLTVTDTMADFLREEMNMKTERIITLHDRPADQFHSLSDLEIASIIKKFEDSVLKDFKPGIDKIVVTSTSYTPDENFGILISALKLYDKRSLLPKLFVVVTGKGPLKDDFLSMVKSACFKNVFVRTCWLEASDYPLVLGSADIGISLHESSSGIDLPMKVVDMFGCGVPVISLGFKAIPELVKDGGNGTIVTNYKEMCQSLEILLTDEKALKGIKQGALRESRYRWNENWLKQVGSVFGVYEYIFEDDDLLSDSD